MKIGDQVLYLLNDEIDLDRDLGSVEDIDGEWLTVRFNDGFRGPIPRLDVKRLVTRHEKRMNHGYFGCLETPCPDHSTSSDQE